MVSNLHQQQQIEPFQKDAELCNPQKDKDQHTAGNEQQDIGFGNRLELEVVNILLVSWYYLETAFEMKLIDQEDLQI